MKFVIAHKLDFFLLFLLIVGYFVLRLPNLTIQPIFADEAIYVRWAQVMKSEPTLRFISVTDGKTPLFMWLMTPLFKVFSDPLFAGRFLSVISGFFTLLGVYFLSLKIFGKKVALWAVLFYVITPYTVFFDRMALVDPMLAAFTIWIIYFALLLIEKPRWDLAMILGYFMGGAILTKTPGLVNLLILPFSIVAFRRSGKNSLSRLILLWFVAIGIALIIYNLLRLGPEFQKLSSRNADYVFSFSELKGRPLDPFIPHFHDISDWFPKLFTIPTLLFIVLGIFIVLKNLNRKALVLLVWLLIPLLISMTFLKTFTARYLLTSVASMLIFAGVGLNYFIERIRINKLTKIILAFIIVLPMSLKFDMELTYNPPPSNLPQEERRGYFEDWTAGYGLKEIAIYLEEQKKKGPVVVGTAGFFGTLPDGLQIYLDKSNIGFVGSSSIISDKIRNAAKNNQTFFVGNKNSLEGSVRNVILIKEFTKTKPLDGSKADAMMLYSVLPQ